MRETVGSRLTYANVMATAAMFVALGGGAYALNGIPDRAGMFHGCVTRRTGLLRVVKRAGACHKAHGRGARRNPGEFAVTWNEQGRQGLQGPQGVGGAKGDPGQPGQDATKLFGYIRDTGSSGTATVAYGKGVTGVSDPSGDGPYVVTFDRSLTNCVVQATEGFGDPAGSAATSVSHPSIEMNYGVPNQVRATFYKLSTSSEVDDSFMITAFC